jgi:hypothetical protein
MSDRLAVAVLLDGSFSSRERCGECCNWTDLLTLNTGSGMSLTVSRSFTLRGQAGSVKIGYSPDGTRLVTPAADGTIKVWDASTAQELLTLSLPRDGVPRAASAPMARGRRQQRSGARLPVAARRPHGGRPDPAHPHLDAA